MNKISPKYSHYNHLEGFGQSIVLNIVDTLHVEFYMIVLLMMSEDIVISILTYSINDSNHQLIEW